MTELTEEALHALTMATADLQSIRLPLITDPRVYRQVDRALTRIAGGGRWDRKTGTHVFPRDPRPDLEQLIGSAVIPHPTVTEEKEHSYWPTPAPLAKLLIDGLDLPGGARVLEPSAGDGQLVRAVLEAYPHVRVAAVEPDPGRRIVLCRAFPQLMYVWAGTFEEYAEQAAQDGVGFDAVVMNPPFTLPGRRYAWAEHLVLAWGLLRPGGQLRAVAPASLGFGRQRPIVGARAVIGAAGGTFRPAPEGSFRGSGTGVHTVLVEATKTPDTGGQ